MTKHFFKVALVAAFALIAGFNVYNSQKDELALSDLMLDNVEALANTETSDCYNSTNGYRSWKTSGGIFGSKKEFYDCCKVLRQGYKPEGNCN